MNTVMNIKHHRWTAWFGLAAIAVAVQLQGCSQEPTSDGGAAPDAATTVESPEAEHGHVHEEDGAHGHGHEHGDDGHEDTSGDETPTTVDGLLHAIAETHGTIETARTDEEFLSIHHAPFEIHDMFTGLRPKLDLSEADAETYDDLLGKIGQKAELIEQHAHDENVELLRAIVEKLNADIEALEKVAAPDHVH